MVATARKNIREIETPELIKMVGDPDVVIVDIRDIRERQRSGFIPGSFHAPRGMIEFWIDPDSPYFKPIFGEDKTFILHCASGWRSALSCQTLNEMGFEAAHLREGFSTPHGFWLIILTLMGLFLSWKWIAHTQTAPPRTQIPVSDNSSQMNWTCAFRNLALTLSRTCAVI